MLNNLIHYSSILFLFLGISLGFIIKGSASLFFFILVFFGIYYFFTCLKNRFYFLIYLFCGILIANIFNNIYYLNFDLKSYDFSIRFFLVYFVIISLYKINLNINKLLSFSFSISIILCSIYFFFFSNPNSIFGLRAHTSFVDPNTLGIYIGLFSIFLFSSSEKITPKVFIVLILGLFIIILSKTRTSWIGLIFTFPFLILFIKFFDNNYRNKFLSIILYILFFSLLLFIFSDRFISTFIEFGNRISGDTTGTSVGDRLSLGLLSLHILKSYNLFLGVDSSTIYSFDVFSIVQNLNFDSAVYDIYKCCGFHNQFISTLFKYGIFGLFSFLAFIFAPFYFFYRNRNENLAPYLPCFIYIFICGFGLDTINLKYTQSIFLFLYAGFFSNYLKNYFSRN